MDNKKSISAIAIVAVNASIAITSCTLENTIGAGRDYSTVKYSVSMNHSAMTKSSDETVVSELILSDKSGGLTIPMESEVSEGIALASGSVVTKGTQVNTTGDDDKTLETFADIVGSFVAKAYDVNGNEKVFQTVTWSQSGSTWAGSPVAYWPQATSLNFLAYANLPSGQTAAIASSGVSTSHTVPATADAQTDILFGYYQGNGGNTGTAEIRFEHPLTAVRFKYGAMDGNPVIKSIRIDGVAESGTAAMAPDGTISWDGVSAYDYVVSQEGDASTGLPVDATTNVIGEPFLIIPQTLADHNVEVTVTFTDGIEVVATLTSGEWKAGYTNTYTLGYQDEWEYYVTGMEPVVLTYAGGQEEMSVKSYRMNRTTSETEPVAWYLEYSADGENWSTTKPDWLTFSSTSGSGAIAGESITATISAQSGVPAGDKPVKEKHDANLRAAAPKGTSTDRFDLSYFNAATGEVTANRSTANTYVVSASGYYKLPLVYGNAIKNGSTNTDAYIAPAPSESGTFTHYLRNFVNHADKPISDPWIKNGLNADGSSIGTSGLNACIVWQDANSLISNVSIDGDYLTFDVANSTITQGNCMVAVRNSSNTILWSWQIWVTDEDVSDVQRVTIGGKQYDFMKVLLGWYSTGNAPVISYAGRTCYVRANNGRVTSDSTVEQTQHEEVSLSTRGSCTMYQWGRKDPFPGGDGDFTNKYRGIYQNAYNVRTGTSNNLEWFSIGTAIQSPYYMNFRFDAFWDWNPNYYSNLWNVSISISDENMATQGYNFGQYKSIKTTKTIYDPSPVGFMIPNGEAYDGIAAQESGSYTYDSNARGYIYHSESGDMFIPCCGYRNTAVMGSDGSPYWYQTSGFAIWSSSPAHTHTSYMLCGDPNDGFYLSVSNSNRPYLLGIALIAE